MAAAPPTPPPRTAQGFHSPARSVDGRIVEMQHPARHSRSRSNSHASPSTGANRVTNSLKEDKDLATSLLYYESFGTDALQPLKYSEAWAQMRARMLKDTEKRLDVFDLLTMMFGFQAASALNQRDAFVSALSSRLSNKNCYKTPEKALKLYHDEIFKNYDRWCSYIGASPTAWHKIFGEEPKDKNDKTAKWKRRSQIYATSVALMLLIWGEAGNLRFCPEYLCFLYNKMALAFLKAVQNYTVGRVWEVDYLDKVILPAYNLLATEAASAAAMSRVDHARIKNYDDFNEIFWRRKCLAFNIDTVFKTQITSKPNTEFKKTFIERQSWLLCLFAFWRLHTFFLTVLHILIVASACQDLGTCNYPWLLTPVFTLYGASAVKDFYEFFSALALWIWHAGSKLQLAIIFLRLVCKVGWIIVLAVVYKTQDVLFGSLAGFGFLVAVASEAVLLTPLWNILRLAGTTMLRRSFSVLDGALGVNSVNLYTRIHRQPPLKQRLSYCFLWVCALVTKLAFSYYVVIRPLVKATHQIWKADVSDTYNFLISTVNDPHNVAVIVAMWAGSVTVFFVDMQIWYVLWANIFAAFVGLRRRVGEVHTSNHVVAAFDQMHDLFFAYRSAVSTETDDRSNDMLFALLWNEIVMSMRKEDTLSNTEALSLRYFVMQLAPSAVRVSQGRAGEKAPAPMVLRPEFLYSGAIQRSVDEIAAYTKKQEDMLNEIKRLEGLAKKQEDKLAEIKRLEGLASEQGEGDDQTTKQLGAEHMVQASGVKINEREVEASVMRRKLAEQQNQLMREMSQSRDTEESVPQAFIALFVVVDGLCGSEALTDALWAAQAALRGDKKKPPLAAAGRAIGKILLFRLDEWPKLVKALHALLRALVDEARDKYEPLLHTLMQTLSNALDVRTKETDCFKKTEVIEILQKLQAVQAELKIWLAAAAATKPQNATQTDEEKKKEKEAQKKIMESAAVAVAAIQAVLADEGRFKRFRKDNESFLRRSKLLLEAGADSQPGFIQSEDARRRIAFFVNSLFVEQPGNVKSVLEMPSFSTLTPYYEEEVVSSMASLKRETEDGVTVLEYLRTIYPGEWDAFLERMKDTHGATQDVIELLKEIIYDAKPGTDKAKIQGNPKLFTVVRAMMEMRRSSITTSIHGDSTGGPPPLQLRNSISNDLLQTRQRRASQPMNDSGVEETKANYQNSNSGNTAAASNGSAHASRNNTGSGANLAGFVASAFAAGSSTFNYSGQHRPSLGADSMPDNHQHNNNQAAAAAAAAAAPHGFGGTPLTPTNDAATNLNSVAKSKSEREAQEVQGKSAELLWELQMWASHRAQTLARTVRGMMRFSEAVRLLAVVEHWEEFQPKTTVTMQGLQALQQTDDDIEANVAQGCWDDSGTTKKRVKVHAPKIDRDCPEWKLSEQIAETKYRYVVSCQIYKKMRISTVPEEVEKADCIDRLAKDFPGLRIAYVDNKPMFKSVLLKWNPEKDNGKGGKGAMDEEYAVALPGDILVGEAKPNNQNHAIIFTRGEAVQAIDMNQDQGLEDALKCRQLLAEFNFGDAKKPNLGRIVGYREHVFTHNVSSVAMFFSLQELNFVTATQRVVADPFAVRFHYGHPDLFDKVSAMTFGGISKASKGLNLSEDIFAGFNWVLRGGDSTQADYIQCGKGRDTGVQQISNFTAKVSMGNGMQARSRDVYRLAQLLDFPRMLTFYYSTVGGFMTQVFLIWSVFLFLYARVYLGFSTSIDELLTSTNVNAAVGALSAQYAMQLGFLLILPIPLVVAVEFGLARALGTLAGVLLRMSPFFFVFSAGTNAYYVNTAIEHGKAKYLATGRGFTITHVSFLASWKGYFCSHYQPAAELLALLFIYAATDPFGQYLLQTFSVWLLVIGWLFCPIFFNPHGLDQTYMNKDATEWCNFMVSPVEDARKAWTAWYSAEARRDYDLMFRKKIWALIRRLRFLIICWGFLAKFHAKVSGCPSVAWLALICLGACALLVTLQEVTSSAARKRRSITFAENHMRKWRRMLDLLALFVLLFLVIGALVLNITTLNQICQALAALLFLLYFYTQCALLFVKDAVLNLASVRETLRAAHTILGGIMLAPVMLLSFLPFMKDLQTSLNFNEDFSKRLNIARIFLTEKARQSVSKKDN